MTIEIQASDLSQDGSVSLTVDGKAVKYVKESDLGAVKGALKDRDTELSTIQANLATANTKYDTEHQLVLQERTAKEQFETSAKEGLDLKLKNTELETTVADLTKASGESTNKLTEQLRASLVTTYKVDQSKLDGKALPELENIQAALQLTGVAPNPAKFDGGGGGGGGGNGDLQGKSPLQLAVLGYENSDKK